MSGDARLFTNLPMENDTKKKEEDVSDGDSTRECTSMVRINKLLYPMANNMLIKLAIYIHAM